jgi:hypothetical protein
MEKDPSIATAGIGVQERKTSRSFYAKKRTNDNSGLTSKGLT